jgi:hypothetical protein
VPNKTVDDFVKALETDKLLRGAVSFHLSMLNVARLWTGNENLTEAELLQAIKSGWGDDCFACISKRCLSEVPGF